jgi:hypothetical protein
MKVSIKIKTSDQLSAQTIDQMWDVYKEYYHYSAAYFRQRIHKNTHFALFLKHNKIIGFTGLRINKVNIDGKKTSLFYLGQTVIHHNYRGKKLLRRMGIKLAKAFCLDFLLRRGYLWCDAISYKSYMAIAKGMCEFYPTFRNQTPQFEDAIIQFVGKKFYGDSFCSKSGTVSKKQNFVSDPSTLITSLELRNPDIQYYAGANPGYIQGNGLITLTPMNWTNITYLLHNIWKKSKSRKAQASGRLTATKAA